MHHCGSLAQPDGSISTRNSNQDQCSPWKLWSLYHLWLPKRNFYRTDWWPADNAELRLLILRLKTSHFSFLSQLHKSMINPFYLILGLILIITMWDSSGIWTAEPWKYEVLEADTQLCIWQGLDDKPKQVLQLCRFHRHWAHRARGQLEMQIFSKSLIPTCDSGQAQSCSRTRFLGRWTENSVTNWCRIGWYVVFSMPPETVYAKRHYGKYILHLV